MYNIPCLMRGNTVYHFNDASGNVQEIHTLPITGWLDIDYAMGKYFVRFPGRVDIISESTLQVVDSFPCMNNPSARIRVSLDGQFVALSGNSLSGGSSQQIIEVSTRDIKFNASIVTNANFLFTPNHCILERNNNSPDAGFVQIRIISLSDFSSAHYSFSTVTTSLSQWQGRPLYLSEDLKYVVWRTTRDTSNLSTVAYLFDTTTASFLSSLIVGGGGLGSVNSSNHCFIYPHLHCLHGSTYRIYDHTLGHTVHTTHGTISNPDNIGASFSGHSRDLLSFASSLNANEALLVDYKRKTSANIFANAVFRKRTNYLIEGNIKDITGNNAQRRVSILDPNTGRAVISGLSDPVTGNYSLPVTQTLDECTRVIFSEEANRNDIVDRIVLS